MEKRNDTTAPPFPPNGYKSTSSSADQLRRKQSQLRRHLLDPSSPGFRDPIRSARLAGFDLNTAAGDQPNDGLPYWLPARTVGGIIKQSIQRKIDVVKEMRQRISVGMNAIKVVDVYHAGIRETVAAVDYAERRKCIALAAQVERLDRSGTREDDGPFSEAIADAIDSENKIRNEVDEFSPADRILLREGLEAFEAMRNLFVTEVVTERLGKSPEKFYQEIEHEAAARLNEYWAKSSAGRQQPPPDSGPEEERA